MDLPRYLDTNKKGRNGLSILTKIVENELGWIVRTNHQEVDFGIDAFLDIIIDGFVTGKSIAVQVKSGRSYFKSKKNENWSFHGEKKHLNYYLNHDIPVLIILVDIEKELAFWEVCKVEYVELQEEGWTMPIPKNQQICYAQKDELLNYVPSVIDYVSQLDDYWMGNKLLSESGTLCIFAGKDDIESMNYQPLIDLIERICLNKHHLSKFRENIEIGIHGFDDDSRELYQIPEVKNWIIDIFNHVPGLTYFLTNGKQSQFLKVFLYSSVKLMNIDSPLKTGKVWVEFESKELTNVFETLFSDLNTVTEAFNISTESNEAISNNIAKRITGKELDD